MIYFHPSRKNRVMYTTNRSWNWITPKTHFKKRKCVYTTCLLLHLPYVTKSSHLQGARVSPTRFIIRFLRRAFKASLQDFIGPLYKKGRALSPTGMTWKKFFHRSCIYGLIYLTIIELCSHPYIPQRRVSLSSQLKIPVEEQSGLPTRFIALEQVYLYFYIICTWRYEGEKNFHIATHSFRGYACHFNLAFVYSTLFFLDNLKPFAFTKYFSRLIVETMYLEYW